MKSTQSQQGVALLTVVLIVSIVTILATAMATRQHLDIRRSASIMQIDQLEQYARSASDLGMRLLWEDTKENKFDDESDIWGTDLPMMAIGNDGIAGIDGQVIELNRYLNVNNLVDSKGDPVVIEIKRMKRLFVLLEIEPDLVDAIVDWIDPKQDVYRNGAEDYEYLILPEPYRTADSSMVSISELRLVKGFDQSVIEKLYDPEVNIDSASKILFITALPSGSKLNVNTAPAVVLRATFDNMIEIDAEALMNDEPVEVLSDFMKKTTVNQAANANAVEPLLDVSSDYFMLSGVVTVSDRYMNIFSLLKRDNETGKSVVIYQSQGVF